MNLPFQESEVSPGFVRRIFGDDLSPEELQWHWDEEDRTVHFMSPNDWQFQMDNELPIPCEGIVFIPRGAWHRLIKGSCNLEVLVKKHF